MVEPGVAARAVTVRRAVDGPFRLLRADLLPVVVAVLGHRFGSTRVIGYAEFVEQVAQDLDELRDAGFALPRTAQEYATDWVASGYLVRRPGAAAREETVELSRSAADVVRFVGSAQESRSAVTSSRLSNVTGLLDALARESDPDATTRVQGLREERDRIDREIARIEAGDYEPLDDLIARERLTEILRLAGEVPGDFAKVADDLESLNGSLREQIINNDGSRGGVLEDVFLGVDLIETSEAGRTFNAFHELLLDSVLADRFDASVEALLDRRFTGTLPAAEVVFLRRYLTVLQRESHQVRRSLTDFSRSLRRFVETQEYREHKRLAEALSRADQAALAALKRHPPTAPLGRDLDLTSTRISSVGAWALHNPADLRTADEVVANEVPELDLEALRLLVRLTEIDFPELERQIAETVAAAPGATVGDVLAAHPASQGLASIVGLLVLAENHATVATGREEWAWTSSQGSRRTVSAPRYVFTDVPTQWSQP